MISQKIVLATGNKGKVAELSQMLAPFNIEVLPQTELGVTDADETGLTFIENAIIKARHAALATGLPAIADDSGLAVDALQGAPGIYSARYAGEGATDSDNITKLLDALRAVPEHQRGAQFHCVLVYLRHAEDPTPLVCHGVWPGVITTTPAGNGGFGYDPVFFVPSESCTSAELSRERKAQLSHRGRALAQLIALLSQQSHSANQGTN
ncbi:RdgB/HAM1 family non-canonical purine NTP pyrophosphatase [Rheinheimera fenheensis]|uniref:RdgB/HAM1 family non-canonical purine NTP pyrophosphatase n=1 Tax=Rheinheimera fenheensis TaxID=3152295 RepID=UPI003261A8BB